MGVRWCGVGLPSLYNEDAYAFLLCEGSLNVDDADREEAGFGGERPVRAFVDVERAVRSQAV